jgi:hypothetical protein
MDKSEVESVFKRLIEDAEQFITDDLSGEREKAWNYYHGKSDVESEEGKSSVVIRDVRDSVEGAMPSLMEIFAGTEKVVEFEACYTGVSNPQQAALKEINAEEAASYLGYIFQKENPGFRNTHDFIKNGLVAKIGIFKLFVDESNKVVNENYKGLSRDELIFIIQEPDVEVSELTFYVGDRELVSDDFESGELPIEFTADVKIKKVINTKKYVVEVVPPEELIIDEGAKCADSAKIIGQCTNKTVSDLVKMGFDYEEVVEYAQSPDGYKDNQDKEKDARTRYDHDVAGNVGDKSTWSVETYDVYAEIDVDGDGISELHRAILVGSGKTLLSYETWDEQPYIVASPYLTPNTAIGEGMADLLFDLQDINTALIRQVLNNLYNVNNPRKEVVETAVNFEDLFDNKYNGVVRVAAPGMINEMTTPFVGGQTMPILEYFEKKKEERTGVSRESIGLDADALQSSAEIAVQGILGAAQAKLKLIARIFAEVGFAPMFTKLYRLVKKHQDGPITFKNMISNKLQSVDPAAWDDNIQVCANVGLGLGNVNERMGFLMGISSKQEIILDRLGLQNPFVTPAQYAHTLSKMTQLAGYSASSRFFNPPEVVEQVVEMMMQQQQKKERQPDPEVQAKIQADQAKIQLEQQKAQAKIQLEQQKAQANLKLQSERAIQEAAIKNKQSAMDLSLKAAEVQEDNKLEREKATLDHALEVWKAQKDVELRMAELTAEAALEEKRIEEQLQAQQANLRRPT